MKVLNLQPHPLIYGDKQGVIEIDGKQVLIHVTDKMQFHEFKGV